MQSTNRLVATVLLTLLPSTAAAQSVFPVDVLRDGDRAQSGVAVLVQDDVLLSSFGLIGQGDQWIVSRPGDDAALVGAVIATDRTRDLALLRVNGIGGEPAVLALEGAAAGRRVILQLPGSEKPGTVHDIQQSGNRPSLVRHTVQIAEGEFAAPLLNNCGELLGINQSPRILLSRRLQTTTDEFAAVGDLADLKTFLEENGVYYRLAGGACLSEAEQLAAAAQREEALQQRQDELAQEAEERRQQLDAARQAEEQARALAEEQREEAEAQRTEAAAQRQTNQEQERLARQQMLYSLGVALVVLFGLVLLTVHQIRKRKKAQSTAAAEVGREQAKAASAAADLQKASATHPDILLVGSDAEGKEHRLKINGNALIRSGNGQMIGRSAQDADYMLNLDYVSRRHCLLRIHDGRILVKDLDSANGTAVNGTELAPQQEAAVKDGDELRIGMLALRLIVVRD